MSQSRHAGRLLRADYAIRAAAELAVGGEGLVKRDVIAERQEIPLEFLESVLLSLKYAGIVQSQRGAGGGFRLARPAAEISLADIVRAVDGPMSDVRGDRPELVEYVGPARHLQEIWIAVVPACARSWRRRRWRTWSGASCRSTFGS